MADEQRGHRGPGRVGRAVAGLVVAASTFPVGSHVDAPVEVREILYARPFTLNEGYRTSWQRERPVIVSGYVAVLRVNPAFVTQRASVNRVMYGGLGTVEYLNAPHRTQFVVGIVPGPVDLGTSLIWFGSLGSPGEIDVARIEAEWQRAVEAGIEPFPAAQLQQALAAGGAPLVVADRAALLEAIAPLIAAYAPGGS